MKIILVTMQYGYGNKENGIDYISRDGFQCTLEKLGHTVLPLYYDDYIDDNLPLQSHIKKVADDYLPDLILYLSYGEQFSIETLDYLKSKYKTAAWFGDDSWRFDSYSKKYANHFTYCITTDSYSVNKYKKVGQHNIILSHWAVIDQYPVPKFKGYEYDVTFIGGYHKYRDWYLSELRMQGVRVEVFGRGWGNGYLSPERMTEIFASSKININIADYDPYDFRYILSQSSSVVKRIKDTVRMSFCTDKFIKKIKVYNSIGQIKQRTFEIPFFGGFQISDYSPAIQNFFELGQEIVCSKDVKEAALLAKYYLENEEERETIKQRGHIRAVNNYGYSNCLANILEKIH